VQPRIESEFIIERTEGAHGQLLPSMLVGDERRTVLSASALVSRLHNLKSGPPTILVFDQFEELHTLAFDQRDQHGSDALEAQSKIIETAVRLIRDPATPIRLLFVFREDYLAKFERLFYLCPELPDRFLRLTPPTSESLQNILRGPFTTANLPQPCWSHEITPELATILERELQPKGGRVTISLAQTQIVALQLWRSDSGEAPLRERGVDGLVEDYQEQAIASFGRERKLAESLLTFLITKEGTRKVLLEADALEQLHKEERASHKLGRNIFDRLVETRLVRRDYNRNAVSYEIVSEFLVPWILRLKLERATRQARSMWTKRVLALVVFLGLVFLWRYEATSIEAQKVRIVQESQRRAIAAEAARTEAENKLQKTLSLIGASDNERVKALSEQLGELEKSSESQRSELQVANQLLTDKKVALDQSNARAVNAEKKAADLSEEIARVKAENEQLRFQIAMPRNLDSHTSDTKKTDENIVARSDGGASHEIPGAQVDTHPGRVTLSVSDDFKRVVTGLGKEYFTIFEDRVEQTIKKLDTSDAPVSIAIVLDAGGAIKPYWQQVRSAAMEFVKTANPQSELLMIECQDQAERIVPFTTFDTDIESALGEVMPRGRSALMDGIYLALNEMKKAKYGKRVIVVVSVGSDVSRHKGREILDAIYKSDVQIYFVPIRPIDVSTGKPDLIIPEQNIQTIATVSGGRTWETDKDDTKAASLADIMTKIGIQIRNNYVFEYAPTNMKRDGKLRHVEIKISPPKGLPHLSLAYRRGYYAPSQ